MDEIPTVANEKVVDHTVVVSSLGKTSIGEKRLYMEEENPIRQQ